MTAQLELPTAAEEGLGAIRTLLKALRGELRDRGLAPMEAAEVVACGLAGHRDARLEDTSLDQLRDMTAETGGRSQVLALLYQEFLVAEARSGLGQYLTPVPVADLIADVLREPAPDDPLVLDPFCGAGILLDRFSLARPDSRLAGLEINRGVGAIAQALAQLGRRELDLRLVDSFESWATGQLPLADVVVTNPPFGSVASSINASDYATALPSALRAMKSPPAELLGLEVSVDSLVEGGLIAAVLPQSVLTNTGWSPYRRRLLSRLQLTGVVSLPEETFAPFRGVARACVIFGRKRSGGDGDRRPVPFFRSRSIGYDDTGRASGTESDLAEASACVRGLSELEWSLAADESGVVHIPPSIRWRDGETVRLGDIADVFAGRTPPRADYVDNGPFLLKVGNLRGSFVSWADRTRSRISEDMFARNPRLHLRRGDIAMTAAAHRPRYVGRKVDLIYEVPSCGAMPSAEVIVIRLRADAPVEPEELLFHLRSPVGYQQIQDLVRGSTAHLYAKDVVELRVPGSPSPQLAEAVRLYREAAGIHLRAVRAEQAALEAAGLTHDGEPGGGSDRRESPQATATRRE